MEDMNANAAQGRTSRLPPPGDRRADDTAERRGRRPVRDPPQPVRVLPLAHRLQPTCAAARRRLLAPRASDLKHRSDDAELRVHHARTSATTATTPRASNGQPGGLVSGERVPAQAVPRILHSPAYQHRGLLIVTFDEAEASGSEGDSSACCGEQPGPNIVPPNTPGFLTPGPGGGRVGAVMVSPCIRPGTVSKKKYNHYSLLRSSREASSCRTWATRDRPDCDRLAATSSPGPTAEGHPSALGPRIAVPRDACH